MAKVNLEAEDIVQLLEHAKTVGTVDNWAKLACDWMMAADGALKQQNVRIKELEKALKEAHASARSAEVEASRLRFPDTTGS